MRGEEDFRRLIARTGGRLRTTASADHAIDLARRNTRAGLLEDALGQVDQLVDVATGFRRQERDRSELQRTELMSEVLAPAVHRHLGFFCQVPLVDDEDHRLVLRDDLVDELLVDARDSFGGVEEHEDDIRSADALLGADHAVELDVVGEAFLFADTGRVDRQQPQAVDLEADVDAVAGRAGNLGNDAAFLLGQGVDERALADIAAADDGELEFWIGSQRRTVTGFVLGRRRQARELLR